MLDLKTQSFNDVVLMMFEEDDTLSFSYHFMLLSFPYKVSN